MRPDEHHHVVKVLAFLAEQKVATGLQIEKYCFYGLSRSFAWKTIKKMRQARLIESTIVLNPNRRPFSVYQLTSDGFKELKIQSDLELEEIQIKSNSPKHDIILTDLRLFFSQVTECQHFVSENIIRSKILEDDVKEMSAFRSSRSDAVLQMVVDGRKVWLALEFERSRKSNERYIQRIRNWYQSENLPGILVVTEDEALTQIMSKIDSKTIPSLPRKVLFLSLNQLQNSMTKVKFVNCQNELLTFHLGKPFQPHYPILNQNAVRS